jgi:hypothetical protein
VNPNVGKAKYRSRNRRVFLQHQEYETPIQCLARIKRYRVSDGNEVMLDGLDKYEGEDGWIVAVQGDAAGMVNGS